MTKYNIVIAAAIATILTVYPAWAATVYGYVTDSKGMGVELATVRIEGGRSCGARGSRFECSGARPGPLTLEVKPRNGKLESFDIHAGPGQTRHNLRLQERN